MIVTGIVVEYNPFHNGHIHHIKEARQKTNCDVLVAVMSGNFVQRGEPAIINKWERTKAALEHEVDLIIEIPFPFVNQNASVFAKAAVQLLKLAQCDYIVFGSETNNIEELKEFSNLNIRVDHLKELMDTGMSYPEAYGLLSKAFYPNDILAIAYLKALKGSNITPIAIQRTNHYHDQTINDQTIVSASAIRNALRNNEEISKTTPMAESLKSTHLNYMADFYPMIRSLLLTSDPQHLSKICLFSEGIENHLIKQAERYYNYDDFINNSTSRRYTTSRIQRTLVAMMTQIMQQEIDDLPPLNFLKVLGFNEIGQKYLRTLMDQEIKVITRFNKIPEVYAQLELKTAAIYALNMNPSEIDTTWNREFSGPIIRKGDQFVNE